jgi:hypothetical protein
MRRSLSIGVAALLLVIAGVLVLQQVRVTDTSGAAVACGSPFDVVVDRVDWRDWYAADLARAGDGPVVFSRSMRCPDALNSRLLLAGGLLVIGVVEVVTFEIVGTRRARSATPPRRRALPMQRLGNAAMVTGLIICVGGVGAIVRLVANPDSTLFLYVDRWVAVVIGLLILLPAVWLVVAGRALTLAARPGRTGDGPST